MFILVVKPKHSRAHGIPCYLLSKFKRLRFSTFRQRESPLKARLGASTCSGFVFRKGNPQPQHTHPTERIYIDFYDEWQSTLHKAAKRSIDRGSVRTSKENMKEQGLPRIRQEKAVKEKKKQGNTHFRKGDVKSCSRRSDGLVQKMKELEMLDRGDMEQELDIEEAIHYYSRLRSPVYLEIVDRFFMDIHSEFSVPEASAKSMNSSKRRL